MKRQAPLIVGMVVGLFAFAEFYLPWRGVGELQEELLRWAQVLAAFAFVLGGLNVVQVNWPKIRRRQADWQYKVLLLAAALVMALAGVKWHGPGGERASGAYTVSRAAPGQLGDRALIRITTTRDDAVMLVAGRRSETSPFEVTVPPGEHLVEVRVENPDYGYSGYSAEIALEAGQVAEVRADLVTLWGPTGRVYQWIYRYVFDPCNSIYNTVEELEEGDTVFLSLDLDPASTPELEPFYRAVVLHLKRKNIKLVLATTWYQAPPLVEKWIRQAIERPLAAAGAAPGYIGAPDRAYRNNVDYVWLGFREGKQAVMQSLGKDLRSTFDHRAADGTPLADIPMMQGIERLADFELMVMVSAGFPGIKEWVQQVQTRYDLRMVGSCTAVSTTDLTPYYDAGQLLGLAGGMAASAEYEKLVGRPAQATAGADVLNVGHLVVILAIVLGNLAFLIERRRKREGLR